MQKRQDIHAEAEEKQPTRGQQIIHTETRSESKDVDIK